MKVCYVCDSCRSTIAEFDDPGFTGLDQLTPTDRDQLVQQLVDTVVLSTLCDECAEVLVVAAPILGGRRAPPA